MKIPLSNVVFEVIRQVSEDVFGKIYPNGIRNYISECQVFGTTKGNFSSKDLMLLRLIFYCRDQGSGGDNVTCSWRSRVYR